MVTRAMTNNNPFNIPLTDNNYIGKVPRAQNTDGKYEQFVDRDHGIRAGIRIFIYYLRRRKLDTPRKMINEFCPWVTAKPEMYYWYLVLRDVNLDEHLTYPSPEFCKFLVAIIFIESGLNYSYRYMYTIIRKFKLY